jgi:hypothetical protein
MKTEICLTVDVEFSVGGAFGRPDLYEPIGEQSVLCNVNGRSEGLGCLLEILDAHDAKATFFVDAMQCAYFGHEPMGRITEMISSRGHDIQLHLHPSWKHFKSPAWRTTRFIHPSDSCAGRSDQEMDDLFGYALECFSQWQQPKPIAIRTGNFMADATVYRSMHRAGITLGSNVAQGTGNPVHDVANGRHRIEGCIEVPCFAYLTPNFRDLRTPRWRHLSITSTSLGEMTSLLRKAREAGVETFVVLLHPFELIKKDGFRYDNIQPNTINRKRLSGLLDFLRENAQEFSLATFGARAPEWLEKGESTSYTIKTSPAMALARMAENYLNDRI